MFKTFVLASLCFCLAAKAQQSELHRAAVKGDLDRLKLLVAAGADLNSKDSDGATSLHYAILYDRSDLVKFLLSTKADINATWAGSTPMDAAVSLGNLELVRTLLDRGVDIHRVLPTGRCLLHLAAISNQTEVARVLIERGINVNARDKQGVSPLNEAVLRGLHDFAKMLLEAGANPDNESGRTGAVPLNEAIYKNHLDLVELLLAHGANLSLKDRSGFSPMANAVHRKQLDAARSIAIAARKHDGSVRDQLMEEAIGKGYLAMIEMLIDASSDVNAVFPSGATPIDLAARKGRPAIVEFLISKGANANVRDRLGASPLHNASLFGNVATVRILLDKGAAIDLRDSATGATPLHSAAAAGREEVVRLLLERGANPGICTNSNISPFMAASSIENETISKLISAKGGGTDCNPAPRP